MRLGYGKFVWRNAFGSFLLCGKIRHTTHFVSHKEILFFVQKILSLFFLSSVVPAMDLTSSRDSSVSIVTWL